MKKDFENWLKDLRLLILNDEMIRSMLVLIDDDLRIIGTDSDENAILEELVTEFKACNT